MRYGYRTNFTLGENIARINYAILRRKAHCDLQFTALSFDLCRLLMRSGYLGEIRGEFPQKDRLRIYFRFVENRNVLNSIRVVSRPGRRYYATRAIVKRKFNSCVAVLSDSRGLTVSSSRGALGGEVICLVYS